MHVLIIEDDLDLGQGLLAALRAEHVVATWVRRCRDADAVLAAEPFDCVLLDLSLPDGDGLSLLAGWRARHAGLPVIVITARATLADRLAGLDTGADDYVVKPFAMAELLSRIWAVTRRAHRQVSLRWTLGALCIDPRARQAWLDGQELDLPPREFALLLELAREAGAVVSKGRLGQRLDPHGDPVDAATLEVHVSKLRRRIGAHRIRTVRGVGYQLVGE